MGEKGEGFIGTMIKDIWRITRGGWKWGKKVGRVGVGGEEGKGRKLYLNTNKEINIKKRNQCSHEVNWIYKYF